MATDRELQNINLSGELTGMQLGGVSNNEKVLTQAEIDAKITAAKTTANDKLLFNDKAGNEPTWVAGQVYYANGKLNVDTAHNGVTLQVGEEQHFEILNNTGVQINDGQVVRYSGVSGSDTNVVLAVADKFENGKGIAVATMAIPNGQKGIVSIYGLVNNINLSAFANGDTVYLSSTVPGGLTTIAPDIITEVGMVFSNSATVGRLFVKPNENVASPVILAELSRGVVEGGIIEAAYHNIGNFTSVGAIAMDYDAVAGTIDIAYDGKYRMTTNLSFLFDPIGNAEESFNLRFTGSVQGYQDVKITIPRNSGAVSFFPTFIFDTVVGEVMSLSVGGATATLTNIVEDIMVFEIESVNIR